MSFTLLDLDFDSMTFILRLGLHVVKLYLQRLEMNFLALVVQKLQPEQTDRQTHREQHTEWNSTGRIVLFNFEIHINVAEHNRTSHFYNSLLSFPFSGTALYLEEALGVNMPPNKHWYCCLRVYTYVCSFLTSTYLLVTMTFERFYSIIRPHKAAFSILLEEPNSLLLLSSFLV